MKKRTFRTTLRSKAGSDVIDLTDATSCASGSVADIREDPRFSSFESIRIVAAPVCTDGR